MCKEIPDHEIHADEIEDVREAFDPTDEELEAMNQEWQRAVGPICLPPTGL